ncbi:MAG: cell envelope biogenesis protein TolA [Fretibacterium sp.]|nr:cell envelope biogenesis protein TolA [Fretibacterium sp.]
MAENPTIAEIKVAEDKAAAAIQEAKSNAARKLNNAQTNAENSLKEARQSAARQFRDKIRRAEEAAELKAKDILTKREAGAKAFYEQHKGKVASTASWITEEVMGRYGRG